MTTGPSAYAVSVPELNRVLIKQTVKKQKRRSELWLWNGTQRPIHFKPPALTTLACSTALTVLFQMEWRRDHARIHSREEELYVKYVWSQFLLLFTVQIRLNFSLPELGCGRSYLKISYTHDWNQFFHVPTLIKLLFKNVCVNKSNLLKKGCQTFCDPLTFSM